MAFFPTFSEITNVEVDTWKSLIPIRRRGEIESALNRRREKEIMSGTFLYADQGEKFYLLNIEEKSNENPFLVCTCISSKNFI